MSQERRHHMHRLSAPQQKFLHEVRDGTLLVSEVKERHEIADAQMSRWVGNDYFRYELRRAVMEAHERLKLETAQLARRASELIGEMLRGKQKPDQVLADLCLLVLVIATDVKQTRLTFTRGKSRRKELVRPQDLVHPSVKHLEEELLAKLEGKALKLAAVGAEPPK